jgi:beta-mannosidase
LIEPVFIHAYNAKITEQRVDTILTDSFDKATLKSTISLSDAISGTHVNISLLDKSGKTIKSQDVEVKGKKTVEVEWQFDVGKDVELWWPIGHGKQPLYEVIAEIKHKVSYYPLCISETQSDNRVLLRTGPV